VFNPHKQDLTKNIYFCPLKYSNEIYYENKTGRKVGERVIVLQGEFIVMQKSPASGAPKESGDKRKPLPAQTKACPVERKIKGSGKPKKKRATGIASEQYIDRHKYTDFMVSLSVELYVKCRCGLRKTVQILEVLKSCFKDFQPEELPSYNSIANWVQKSGYCLYKETDSKDISGDYALIVDESMMIGSEKLLLTLGVPALKTGESSLKEGDVHVLDMSVKTSWNGESIKEVFEGVEEKMGSAPAYVVSDNGSTIVKAVREKGYVHVRDVGHSIGLLVQQVYEKAKDFQSFMKEVTAVKFRETMRATAYLLPPKQRTVARFMNISHTVCWAASLLKSFHRLNAEEQKVFQFIKDCKLLINELKDVFIPVNAVLKRLKKEGLSGASVRKLLPEIKPLTASGERIAAVERLMEEYITGEYGKLSERYEKWHVSSDIIESMFGSYKARKSSNAMNGVTKQIFLLPVMTRLKSDTKMDKSCFKNYLEKVFLQDLDEWRNTHLSVNRTVKRKKLLCA
jgi:hypothetical protein